MIEIAGSSDNQLTRLRELATLFLKLGFTAFGGPVAHIALYHHEVVERRKWLDEQEFLDLLSITNLIPGPNSTEMVIFIGKKRAGWAGMVVAGLSFILPPMAIVLFFSWLYMRFGTLPQAGWLLAGIQPVIIAILLQALWNLGRKAVRNLWTGLLGLAALLLYFANIHPIAIMVICGLVMLLAKNRLRWKMLGWLPVLPVVSFVPAAVGAPFNLGVLFLTFLKIGAVLYGSGYVLLAFLHAEFVTRLGWLTEQQLLDSITIGQVTPGPLFTSATFIGYILGGVPAAILGTVGIFLPSFVFVALTSSFISTMRSSPWLSSLLDGINIGSLGMMAGVSWQLAYSSLNQPLSIGILVIAGLLVVKYNVNTTWLILAGALLGLILQIG